MADIYLRGKTWWGRVQKDGKDIRQSLATRSQSLARTRLKIWLDELEGLAWGSKPRHTLNHVMMVFQSEHFGSLRPSTIQRYGVSIDHLDAALGDRIMLSLRPVDFKEFETARRSAGAAAPTVRRDLMCLSSIYGFAIEKEWIDLNPISAYLRQRAKRGLRESPPRTRYLTRAEEARLLQGAVPYVCDAIVFAIYTGLRQEEQFSLTWSQVDLVRKHVTVSAETAKGKRERTIILLQPALDVLAKTPRHLKSPYVFHHGAATTKRGRLRRAKSFDASTNDGERFNHLDRGLHRAAERGQVKRIRWHDLRRTHGCRLLQEEKWSMEMVRDQLGHRSVVQTEKAYAFLDVEARREAAHGPGTNPGTGPAQEIDAQTGEAITAQKPAQGQRNDLTKRTKSKA